MDTTYAHYNVGDNVAIPTPQENNTVTCCPSNFLAIGEMEEDRGCILTCAVPRSHASHASLSNG